MNVGVVDYDAGNLRSVQTALDHLGARYRVSRNPAELARVDRLIFPGVGEAASAMDALARYGLDRFIRDFAASGRPLLGICLGYQILMEFSQERDTQCLGILPGDVRLFEPRPGRKVPHMGWNQVVARSDHWLFRGVPNGSSFYFVHSYYVAPSDPALVTAETDYDQVFASAVGTRAIAAVQFHPEKSGRHGLALLRNFLTADIPGGA